MSQYNEPLTGQMRWPQNSPTQVAATGGKARFIKEYVSHENDHRNQRKTY